MLSLGLNGLHKDIEFYFTVAIVVTAVVLWLQTREAEEGTKEEIIGLEYFEH